MFRILFPSDFSPASKNAFIYALDYARAFEGSIDVIHVQEDLDNDQLHLPKTLEDIKKEIELEKFEQFKASIPELEGIANNMNYQDIDLRYIMEKGNVEAKLSQYANSDDYDMLIMGTKGMNAISNVFLGSTTSSVMNEVSKPVLAIPDEAVFDGCIDHLLFVTDYSEDEKKALEKANTLATNMKAELHCIHFDLSHTDVISHADEKWKNSLDFDKSGITFKSIDTNDIDDALEEYCKANAIDVIIMLTKHKNLLERLFSRSLTREILGTSHTPVLCIKNS